MKRYSKRQSMRSEFAVSMLISAFVFLYIYTFLHEGGHILVGILNEGRFGKIVMGFSENVSTTGTHYKNFAVSLFYMAGLLLPVLVFFIVVSFYKNSNYSIFYSSLYFVLSIGVIGSTIEWILVPVFSRFSASSGNDVINFIQASNINPIIVSIGATFLALALIRKVTKKGVIRRYFQIFRSL